MVIRFTRPNLRDMPVFRSSKLFFYHIPKTGGSLIESAFFLRSSDCLHSPDYNFLIYQGIAYAAQHMTPEVIQKFYPEFSDFESFCVVRDPIERLLSGYLWLMRDFYRKPVRRFREAKFERWYHEEYKLMNRDHFLPQFVWADRSDYVFRIEDMDKIIDWLAQRLGIPAQVDVRMAKRSQIKSQQLVAQLSPPLKKRLLEDAQADIVLIENLKSFEDEIAGDYCRF